MSNALVIGNGESRKWFTPCHQTIMAENVITWGCNAIHREGTVDNLVSFKELNENETIIEFAYQGPRLRLDKGSVQIVITGDVHFIISKKSENFSENIGETFRTYQLNEGDIIDILATKSSVYGYFGVLGGFKINKYNNCGSTLVR